jgi:cell division protein ZapA (FtsZ GTPase activity inhibitor)
MDVLKIVVEVPEGVRDLEEIKKHIIRVMGIDYVVYCKKDWDEHLRSITEPPVS